MSRALEIADAITKNWLGTPPAWAVDAQNELRRLEAQNAQMLEKAKELCDRIYDEGCTPLDWREYDDLRAAIAAVEAKP